jgi:hypothetical protein
MGGVGEVEVEYLRAAGVRAGAVGACALAAARSPAVRAIGHGAEVQLQPTSSTELVLKLRSMAPATLPAARKGAFWQKAIVADRLARFTQSIVIGYSAPSVKPCAATQQRACCVIHASRGRRSSNGSRSQKKEPLSCCRMVHTLSRRIPELYDLNC